VSAIRRFREGSLYNTRSETGLRRIAAAQRIALDGKFELCTARASTASPLLLPRRKPNAPLLG